MRLESARILDFGLEIKYIKGRDYVLYLIKEDKV